MGTNAKLETPVTYFYSPRPLRVSVSARFPQGFFSQWFPYVTRMLPPVMDIAPSLASGPNLVDRWMQSPEEIPASAARASPARWPTACSTGVPSTCSIATARRCCCKRRRP
jgi:hypothetical protein